MIIKENQSSNDTNRVESTLKIDSVNRNYIQESPSSLSLENDQINQSKKTSKRLFDLSLAAVLLGLFLPVLAFTAFMIKLTSNGPIFFIHNRVGKDGKLFTCYKFRSMFDGSDHKKMFLLHLNEVDGPVFKIKKDPRITPFGRIIRRLSIDELPQLVNVIRGDMSLVGPRPALPAEVKTYTPCQRKRLNAMPGITGLQQISGRSDIDFDKWIELDLKYIDEQSLWLDIWILIQTIPSALSGKGAY